LGISTEGRDKNAATVTYSDELIGFARGNSKFLPIVEKAFADFIASEKRTQVLPHMPPDRRKFVHDLAAVYRMDTQMVDQEPHRSVQLLRRVDTRVPTPVLSAFIASIVSPPSLGKLADFRALKGTASNSSSSPWRTNGTTPSPKPLTSGGGSVAPTLTPSNQRGWTAVVANPVRPVAAPRPMVSQAGTRAISQPQAGPQSLFATGSSGSRTTSPAAVTMVPISFPKDPVPDSWEDDI